MGKQNGSFPIAEILPDVLAHLAGHPRLILEAPPGAGKTTQVPPALLAAPWHAGRKILMLEPRRIAARAAAEFMAAQLGEKVGETVGYRIRFEAKVSARTRIEVVTEGILTRLIQSDPELTDIGAILFDEFHERHLHGDLGAALALEIQNSLRSDLRLVIMSATLDGERVARWFDAPRLSSAGRSFPVRVEYPPAKSKEEWPFHLRRVVESALVETDGDLLVFLPGRREIERAQQTLSSVARERGEMAEAAQPRIKLVSAAWGTLARRTACGAGACSQRSPAHRARDQCRRIERDAARHSCGDRSGPCARAALRSEFRLHASGNREHLAGLRRSARRSCGSCRSRHRVSVVAAEPAPGACASRGNHPGGTVRIGA